MILLRFIDLGSSWIRDARILYMLGGVTNPECKLVGQSICVNEGTQQTKFNETGVVVVVVDGDEPLW